MFHNFLHSFPPYQVTCQCSGIAQSKSISDFTGRPAVIPLRARFTHCCPVHFGALMGNEAFLKGKSCGDLILRYSALWFGCVAAVLGKGCASAFRQRTSAGCKSCKFFDFFDLFFFLDVVLLIKTPSKDSNPVTAYKGGVCQISRFSTLCCVWHKP